MNKKGRVTKNYEYQNVFQNGTSVANRTFVLYLWHVGEQDNRAGFIVSKKVGNAVTRNRVKRLFKESYRKLAPEIKRGFDLVFIARPPAATIGFEQAATEMRRVLQRGGLLTVSGSKISQKEENNG